MRRVDDLVVFSHLRWDWVWQRPQHLLSRIGAHRRLWFVEEPYPTDVSQPRVRIIDDGAARRVMLGVPEDPTGGAGHLTFEDPLMRPCAKALEPVVGADGLVVWLYTPLALPTAR